MGNKRLTPSILKNYIMGDCTNAVLRLDKPGISVRDFEGDSVLHYATRARNAEMVKILLTRKKMNPNLKNKFHITPLMYLCMESCVIYSVATSDVVTSAKYLIKAGAHVNELDKQGYSAIDYLATRRNGVVLPLLQLLISAGADPNACKLSTDNRLTPLIKLIETYTNSINRIYYPSCILEATIAIRTILEAGADVHTADYTGRLPLNIAAQLDERIDDTYPLVDILLAAGADPSLKDSSGLGAIDYAKERDPMLTGKLLKQLHALNDKRQSNVSEASCIDSEVDLT